MSTILSDATSFLLKTAYPAIGLRSLSSSHVNFAWSKDPSKRRAQLNAQNERNSSLRRTDPNWQMRKVELASNFWNRRKAEDPDWYEKRLQQMCGYTARQHAENPTWKRAKALSLWVRRWSWVREELPWKSHRPVLHSSPVKHRCEYCALTRPGGMLLYWQNIAQPTFYSCHACYVKRPEGFMPRGYENITTIKELAARKEQLDKLNSEQTTVKTSAGEVQRVKDQATTSDTTTVSAYPT